MEVLGQAAGSGPFPAGCNSSHSPSLLPGEVRPCQLAVAMSPTLRATSGAQNWADPGWGPHTHGREGEVGEFNSPLYSHFT